MTYRSWRRIGQAGRARLCWSDGRERLRRQPKPEYRATGSSNQISKRRGQIPYCRPTHRWSRRRRLRLHTLGQEPEIVDDEKRRGAKVAFFALYQFESTSPIPKPDTNQRGFRGRRFSDCVLVRPAVQPLPFLVDPGTEGMGAETMGTATRVWHRCRCAKADRGAP
jgi:hypothetical protein